MSSFIVERNGRGAFLIFVNGKKEPARAETTTEVRTALEHYFGEGTFYGNSHYMLNNPRCPLCREIQREQRERK